MTRPGKYYSEFPREEHRIGGAPPPLPDFPAFEKLKEEETKKTGRNKECRYNLKESA